MRRRRPHRPLLAAALALAACGSDPSLAPEPACQELVLGEVPSPLDLVIVVNDTMRRDQVGAYGGAARTPHFDAFAGENLRFDRVFSEAPWTLPAIATLFTSLYPSQHGVSSHPREQAVAHGTLERPLRESDVLSDRYTTLAEVLRRAGYRTGAFVSNPWLDSRFGFAQGFDHYDDRFARFGVPGVAVVRAALAWIRGLDPDRPFFAYIHTIDSHRPYGALDWHEILARAAELRADPRRLTPEQREEVAPFLRFGDADARRSHLLEPSAALLEMAYDKGIENFDAALGVLLDGLAERPGWQRTAVLVTADHGEALYERGYGNHGYGLFDEELAIPMAARLPGVSAPGGRVDCLAGLADVLPTLCRYLGLECPAEVRGESLLPGPGRGPRYGVSEGVMDSPRHRAIRNARWKLVFQPGGGPDARPDAGPLSLYDLRADPGETRDLLEGEPSAEARRVADVLAERLAAQVPATAGAAPERAPLDPEIEQRLRDLGYLE